MIKKYKNFLFSILFLWCASSARAVNDVVIDPNVLLQKHNLVPFLVVGSGPASLSAALYGARAGIKTYMLRGEQPGGQLTRTSDIENWPAIMKMRGMELMDNFEAQVASVGVIGLHDSLAAVDFSAWPYKVTTAKGDTLYALTMMIGTGATPRRLNIPGEQEYWGRGVTTCAICDAPLHRNHKVVVIGGGDTAMEEALQLSAYATEVHVLVRSKELRASENMIQKVKNTPIITIHFEKALAEIKGDGRRVTKVLVKDRQNNEVSEWHDVRGVFLAIGQTPNSELFKGSLDMDDAGYIKVAPHRQITNIPGVTAAGEVCDPYYRQAGVAAGDGIKAGLDMVKWLESTNFYSHGLQKALEPSLFNAQEKQLEIKEIPSLHNAAEYEELIKGSSSDQVVVLDFYATWCPPCMFMLPIVEWAGAKFEGKIQFYKIPASFDQADDQTLMKKFEVTGIPKFVIIKNGKVIGSLVGAMPNFMFYAELQKFLH